MMHLYCNVPACQRCRSNKTGYYISGNYLTERMIKAHLKKGEYVNVMPDMMCNSNNCFCLNCGMVWKDDLKLSLYTQEQINKQKELREINDNEETFKNISEQFNRHITKSNYKQHRILSAIFNSIKW